MKRLLRHLMRGLTAIGLGMWTARIPDGDGLDVSAALTRDEQLWEAELADGDTVF